MRAWKVLLAGAAILLPLTIALVPSQSASGLLGTNDTVMVTNPVTVTNSPSQPLNVRSDDAAKQLQTFSIFCGVSNGSSCASSVVVPAHKLFVIENVSVVVGISSTTARVPSRVRVITTSGNEWLVLTHTGMFDGQPIEQWMTAQQVTLYANPGTTVGFEVVLNGPATPWMNGTAEVSGYFVDK